MKQLSLFDNSFSLAGILPSVKADMRRIAGDEGECRKGLVDKLNALSAQSQVALTGGNTKVISLDTLNKILSPSDTSHPPSVLFVIAFCRAAKDYGPLRIIVRAAGFDLMSEEERMLCECARADIAEKAAKKKKLLLKKITGGTAVSWMNKYGRRRASNKRLIQQALDDAGLNAARIAERTGKSPQAVSATLNGSCHSPAILNELRKVGIAENLLCDPRKQKTA